MEANIYFIHCNALGSKDGDEHFRNRLASATGIVAQASAMESNTSNKIGNGDGQDYPDYSTIPHLPNLQELASTEGGVALAGEEKTRLSDQTTKTVEHSTTAIEEGVVLNASHLQVESEIA